MLMAQQCVGQRGQRPAQAEIALGNKGLNPLLAAQPIHRLLALLLQVTLDRKATPN
jgi:hypothetical protein